MDPIVYRRRLGHRLRGIRENRRLSQTSVMDELGWSRSKINRIETGVTGIAAPDLARLVILYGITDKAEAQSLADDALATRRQSGWSKYQRLVSPEFYAFLAYEESASSIRSYQPLVVPGLLQTEEYAAAVTGWAGRRQRAEVRHLVELRKRRRDPLEQTGPGWRRFSFLLHEAAISIAVGGRHVMRDQLRGLLDLMERSDVTLRVVPFEYGIFPHWRQPYVVLEVGDPQVDQDADVVLYLESPTGESILTQSGAAESTAAGRVTPDPLGWLDDYLALEAELPDAQGTIALLEAALRRYSGPNRDLTNPVNSVN